MAESRVTTLYLASPEACYHFAPACTTEYLKYVLGTVLNGCTGPR